MAESRTCRFSLAAAILGVIAFGMPPARAVTDDGPPTEPASLLAWLQAGRYKAWPKESAPHRSMGSHQTLVVTHLSPMLDRSMTARAAAHPKGAAAVKELLDANGALAGWAVVIKTAIDSDGGKGWFWYEILGTSGGSPVVAQGHGVPLCVGCHARGRDHVLTEHPLD